jgi:hypothetical protein
VGLGSDSDLDSDPESDQCVILTLPTSRYSPGVLTRHILTGRLAWGCPVEPVTCRAQTWIGGWEDHPVRNPVHGAGHSLGTLSVRYGPKPRHGEDHPVRDPVHAAGRPAVTLSVR